MPLVPDPAASVFSPERQLADPNAKITAALDRLGYTLRSLLQSEVRGAANEWSLSPLQGQALLFIGHHDRGLARVGQLAREFDVTAATVSDAVRVLLAKGLLHKSADPDDGRASVLGLTPAGRAAADRLGGWADAVRDEVAASDPEEREAALSFLVGLIGRLSDAGIVSTARACTTCSYLGSRPDGSAGHYCQLVGIPLATLDLRLDCPEHAPRTAG